MATLSGATLKLIRYLLEREREEIETHWITAAVTWNEHDYKNMQAELARIGTALDELATVDEAQPLLLPVEG